MKILYANCVLRLTNNNCFGGDKRRLRGAKNRSRYALYSFLAPTFGAGVNASHCPFTCPKRQLFRTLYDICAKIVWIHERSKI